MKYALAAAIVAGLTLEIARAAESPAIPSMPSPKTEQATAPKGGDPALSKKKKMRNKFGMDKRPDSPTVSPPSPSPGVDPGLDVPSARTRSPADATPMTGTRGLPGRASSSSQSIPDAGLDLAPARSRPGFQGTPTTGTRGIKLKSGEATDKSKTGPLPANTDDTRRVKSGPPE